jgi:hypothetical protein
MAVVVVVLPLNLRSDTEMFTPRRHDDRIFFARDLVGKMRELKINRMMRAPQIINGYETNQKKRQAIIGE